MLENQLSRYGAIAGALPFTPGKIFFVLNNADSDFGDFQKTFPNDRDGVPRVYSDLASAYAATRSGYNDVIVIHSGATSNKVSSMLTVSNNKVHFVGLDTLVGAKRANNSRAIISTTGAGVAADVSMIKVTGTGCSFRGIKFANGFTVAQNLSAVLEYGNSTYYEDCTFHNLAAQHLTTAGAAALILAGGDTIFKNCEIGADTVQTSVASAQSILISKGTSAQAATRAIFDRCWISANTSQTTQAFVRVGADGDIDRYVHFKNCSFINFKTSSNGATLANAFVTAAGLVSGLLLVEDPKLFGVTACSTAGSNASILVIGAPTTAGSANGVAVTPTA